MGFAPKTAVIVAGIRVKITFLCFIISLFQTKATIHLSVRWLHGHSQDFSKGGSHCVKQRVLAFSQPEYCRLFE